MRIFHNLSYRLNHFRNETQLIFHQNVNFNLYSFSYLQGIFNFELVCFHSRR